MMPTRLLSVALVGSLVLAARVGAADEDPRVAQAEALYREGLKLHDGNHESEALDRFVKAHAQYPSPNLLFSIARQEQLLGRSVDALRHFREALKSGMLHPRNRDLGKKYLAYLEARTARVRLVGPAGAKVTLADQEVALPAPESFDVEPGTVFVVGHVGDTRLEGHALARAGEAVVLQLEVARPSGIVENTSAVVSAPIEPPHDAPSRPRRSFWGVRSIAGLGLVAAGAAGLGAGVAFAAQRASKQDQLDQLGRGLSDSACTSAGASTFAPCQQLPDTKRARDTAGTWSSVSFVAGGVAVTAGAALVASAVIAPHERDVATAHVLPVAGAQEAGLLFVSSF